jgi:hypothetical protein
MLADYSLLLEYSGNIEYVNAENIDAIAEKEEVFFVYLHPYASSDQDLVRLITLVHMLPA